MVTTGSDDTGSSRAPSGPGAAPRLAGERAPSLTVAAVARRLGVAPATLRTWDRRYGLGPSEHLAGSHRRYSSTDVARLLVMRRLTMEGVAPSEAARTARTGHDIGDPGVVAAPEIVDAFADAVPMAPDPGALVAATLHFDNAAARWMLARVHPRDVLAWWNELVQPALEELTRRTVLGGPGESPAPSLRAAAFAELRSRAAVSSARSRAPGPGESTTAREALRADAPAVLLVPGGSDAELPLHVLATALQESGVRARVLTGGGARAVTSAVSTVQPSAVLVHVPDSEGQEGHADLLTSVVETDRDLPLFVHRAGSAPLSIPSGAAVHRVRTMTGALHEILAVIG
ncbi:MerR family transcriptional regulator [Actinotalea sp. K2]|uniref:MerR family transcriptional regulator n=1 Tax=Actinotalea sp. K2 TaxID=2939438 RepID=UPI0020183023|nr:MerR family transcriptional regulator [Actinotalea sp. K2]MCL3859972.1 MerR family transcriptional regulator [Actinotalea sp. K2]